MATSTSESSSSEGTLVLVALDGSDHAEKALKWYADNVHRDEFTVLILNVCDPPFVKSEQMIYMSNDLWEEMVNKEKEKFKEIELYYARLLEKKNISGRIRTVLYNQHAEGIVEVARDEDVAMIVMGSHGKGVEQRSLGGITQHVMHHAHCPVIVWRHDHCSHTSKHWDKVLVYM